MLNFFSSKKAVSIKKWVSRIALIAVLLGAAGHSPGSEELPALKRESVLASISHDWDGDQKPDRAIMVRAGISEAFLYVVDSKGRCSKLGGLIVCGANHATPLLEISEVGSLIMREQDTGFGRTQWSAKTTIAYRDGQFVVAGYDFEARDKNREFDDIKYSANYLTGRKIKNGVVVAGTVEKIPLADWDQPRDLE